MTPIQKAYTLGQQRAFEAMGLIKTAIHPVFKHVGSGALTGGIIGVIADRDPLTYALYGAGLGLPMGIVRGHEKQLLKFLDNKKIIYDNLRRLRSSPTP